jgi:hypothetical protein
MYHEYYEKPTTLEAIQTKKDEEVEKMVANTAIMHTDLDKEGLPLRFVRKQNETFFKFAMTNKLMFVDVKNYKLFKSYLNTTQQPFDNVHDIIAYQKKAFENEIFVTERKVVGHARLETVRIPIKPSKRVEKAKIPDADKTFLGITVGYRDNVTDIFTY